VEEAKEIGIEKALEKNKTNASNLSKESVQRSIYYTNNKFVSHDMILNICSFEEVSFVQLKPYFLLCIFIAEMSSIVSSSTVFMIDGTFKLVEFDMIVTVLCCFHQNQLFPFAYLISKQIGEEAYSIFFDQILAKFNFKPHIILSDYERAFRNHTKQIERHVVGRLLPFHSMYGQKTQGIWFEKILEHLKRIFAKHD